ncbi:hypothetical protein NUSPORA_01562 [Nucleospora cyclopteri]
MENHKNTDEKEMNDFTISKEKKTEDKFSEDLITQILKKENDLWTENEDGLKLENRFADKLNRKYF